MGMIAAFPFFAAIGAILLILLNKLPITHTQMGVILVLALSLWFFLGALYFWQLDLIVGSPEYWTVLYWCFVTLSTLGLGDYTPKTSRALSVVSFYVYVVGGISLLSLVVQYLQERALPRSVTGAKDPTAPTQSEGGIDRFQLSNAPEVAVTLERHSLSPYRLTLTDGL